MTRSRGLLEGSAAHRALCRLVNLGGTATKASLLEFLSPEIQSRDSFRMRVTYSLEVRGYVIADRYSLRATPEGKDYVADCEERNAPTPQPMSNVAMPRLPVPGRPLDVSKLFPAPMREGASDYRKYPSLLGNQRVLPGARVVADNA